MKIKVACLALLLALGLVACAKKWDGDPELANKLSVNMAEAEVRQILGEPTGTNRMEVMGIVTETWVYNGSRQIGLVIQDGKLKSAQLDGKLLFQAEVGDF